MSKTKFKNAEKVWNALVEMSGETDEYGYYQVWFTVGEVSRRCGLSYPTVKNYLLMAVEQKAITWSLRPHAITKFAIARGI